MAQPLTNRRWFDSASSGPSARSSRRSNARVHTKHTRPVSGPIARRACEKGSRRTDGSRRATKVRAPHVLSVAGSDFVSHRKRPQKRTDNRPNPSTPELPTPPTMKATHPLQNPIRGRTPRAPAPSRSCPAPPSASRRSPRTRSEGTWVTKRAPRHQRHLCLQQVLAQGVGVGDRSDPSAAHPSPTRPETSGKT